MSSFLGIASFVPRSLFLDEHWRRVGPPFAGQHFKLLSPEPLSGTVSSTVSAQQIVLEACIARHTCWNHDNIRSRILWIFRASMPKNTSIFKFFGLPEHPCRNHKNNPFSSFFVLLEHPCQNHKNNPFSSFYFVLLEHPGRNHKNNPFSSCFVLPAHPCQNHKNNPFSSFSCY